MVNKEYNIPHDLVIGKVCATATVDQFTFLDQSGRKLFWRQGYRGKCVTIAVLDTGVNANHPELTGKVLQGKNFATMYTTDDPADTMDRMGHGTHVAATIAGQLMAGIAPEAKILPVKVLDNVGILWDTTWLLKGLEYVLNWRGSGGERVDIVNMSLSGSGFTATEINSMRTIVQKLNAAGIMVIVSAGNTGTEKIMYPAALEEVIAVGAVDIKQRIAYFSTMGDMVDLCQIGVDVLSADAKSSGYIMMSGTSMAAPIVSGIAALMVCKDKALNSRYNAGLSGTDRELTYYKALKNASLDLGALGTDKIYGAGFCTLNQRLQTELVFQQGSADILVNGIPQTMPAPVTLYTPPGTVNGVTMVPIRAFSDNFMLSTLYDNTTKKVAVSG